MSTDRGLEATRAIREKISREHHNDPRRLVEYYVQYQERFANRLVALSIGDLQYCAPVRRRWIGPMHRTRCSSTRGEP